MDTVKFIASVGGYSSYDDFFHLAKVSDFDLVSENDPEAYLIKIMYGCEYLSNEFNNIILWYLERPFIDGGIQALKDKFDRKLQEREVEQIWVSDYSLWEQLKDLSKFVPIGSAEGLCPHSEETTKDFDFIDLSYMSGRRSILNQIQGRRAPCIYGQKKYTLVSKSKFLVNIHQFEDPIAEHLRFALASASGIPIITETCSNAYPYNCLPGYLEFNYEGIVPTINVILQEDYSHYEALGMEMKNYILANYSFRHNVLKALNIEEG